MFRCRVCMLRCLRGLSGAHNFHLLGAKPLIRRLQRESLSYSTLRITRSLVGGNGPQDGYHKSQENTTNSKVPRKPQHSWGDERKSGLNRWSRSTSKGNELGLEAKQPTLKKLGKTARFRAPQDPVQLADYVRILLAKDRFLEAQDKVRKSSNTVKCTVSWNHLIDWQLANGKLNGAVKTYNEMKKRAQAPDAHTFTILFRGMAANKDYKTSLAKALSIYHAMDADNSPVQPNIIHTNAVLNVCARAGDMDAMFGIAAKLRDTGLRAPNNLTYTIMLNAIREHSAGDGEIRETDLLPIRTKSIKDARGMWADIVGRWRKGDIWIDEELVCSMGRVLLLGTKKDVDDIFSLLEQTMNIKRRMPKYGASARSMMEPSEQGQQDSAVLQPPESDESGRNSGLAQEDDFVTLLTAPHPPKGTSAFATPGRNSLSLVLDALTNLGLKKFAADYWQIFAGTHKVVPDSSNFHSYLRLLRIARASTEATELLQRMPKAMLAPKTFRIAMAACVRDKNNRNAFDNAGKILDLMQQHLADPDIVVLMSYLELASSSPADSSKTSPDALTLDSKSISANRILRALDRLGPSLINIKSTMVYGAADRRKAGAADSLLTAQTRENGLELTKMMVSCYDKLLWKNMVIDETLVQELKQERSKLAAYVTRYTFEGSAERAGLSPEVNKKMWNDQRKEVGAIIRANREAGKNKRNGIDKDNPRSDAVKGFKRRLMPDRNIDERTSQESISY